MDVTGHGILANIFGLQLEVRSLFERERFIEIAVHSQRLDIQQCLPAQLACFIDNKKGAALTLSADRIRAEHIPLRLGRRQPLPAEGASDARYGRPRFLSFRMEFHRFS